MLRYSRGPYLLSLLSLLLACRVLSAQVDATTAPKRVADMAVSRISSPGAPRASDVIMRSLRLRQSRQPGDHDTFQTLNDFHVSRLEWAYIREPEFIQKVTESGRLFGGAASSALTHVMHRDDLELLRSYCCVNLDGEPVIPTWKRTWRPPGSWWMCVNNPSLEIQYLSYLESYVEAGAEVMQRDEPWGNSRAVWWGGCFCEHCMRAFRDYLGEHTTAARRHELKITELDSFDYRERLRAEQAPVGDRFRTWKGGELKELFVAFQTQATIAFHRRTRKALNQRAGRTVPMSCNNGCRRWTEIEREFDWCFGELSMRDATPKFIHDAMSTARDMGRCQVISMPKKKDREDLLGWKRLTRQTIAMAYACGGHCMVPWDVYMPGDAPRYFGKPEDYADLYAFVRTHRRYLDGYTYAGAWGADIECSLYDNRPPLSLPAECSLVAVVRAKSQRRDDPVVVHLIDWSDQPVSNRLTLNQVVCCGTSQLKVTLLQPRVSADAPGAATATSRAAEAGERQLPISSQSLQLDDDGGVVIPPLHPWGMLVLESLQND